MALASLESSVSMTIFSCLYPNRSVVRDHSLVQSMTKRQGEQNDEADESEERERKRGRGEEEERKKGHTNQKLLNVQSIINTPSQFTFLTKVIDPNLSLVDDR